MGLAVKWMLVAAVVALIWIGPWWIWARIRCGPVPDDRRLIETAVNYALKRVQQSKWSYLDKQGIQQDIPVVEYLTVAELMDQNPDCCATTDLLDADGALFSKLTIWRYDIYQTVKVSFAVRPEREEDSVHVGRRSAIIPMTSCGEVIERNAVFR